MVCTMSRSCVSGRAFNMSASCRIMDASEAGKRLAEIASQKAVVASEAAARLADLEAEEAGIRASLSQPALPAPMHTRCAVPVPRVCIPSADSFVIAHAFSSRYNGCCKICL